MKRKTFAKTASVLLTLVMLLSLFPAMSFAGDGVTGDADGDGKVRQKDAQLVLAAGLGQQTLPEDAFRRCDLNGDGLLCATEARDILLYSAGLIPALPDPSSDYSAVASPFDQPEEGEDRFYFSSRADTANDQYIVTICARELAGTTAFDLFVRFDPEVLRPAHYVAVDSATFAGMVRGTDNLYGVGCMSIHGFEDRQNETVVILYFDVLKTADTRIACAAGCWTGTDKPDIGTYSFHVDKSADVRDFRVTVPEGLGDMDGNERVTAGDARFVLRLSARLETASDAQKAAADVDEDGKLTAKDARTILRVSAKLDSFEDALFRPQLNRWLTAISEEAAIILTADAYFSYGSVTYADTPFLETAYARDGDDYYSFVRNGSDIPLAVMFIGGKPYVAEPETKACLELTREICEEFGLDYDELTADTSPVDTAFDHRDYSVTAERSGAVIVVEIRRAGAELYDRLVIVDGKLREHKILDAADDAVYSDMRFDRISETIPDGLLDLSTYRHAKDADEFLRMLG